MPHVRMPDGVVVSFPDDMPDEQIRGMIASKFPRAVAEATLAKPVEKREKPSAQAMLPPGVNAAADDYERVRGDGAFAAATDSGAYRGIPFADELYSALSALPNAAINAARGKGFHPGAEYEKSQSLQKELDRRRSEKHSVGSAVGGVATGIAATSPLSNAGFSFLNGAKPTLASLMGRGAAEGAAYGGVYGLGEGDGIEQRSWNAVKGAGVGGAAGGLFGILGRIMAGRGSAVAPTVDDLRAAGQAAYQQADQAGVIFTPDAVSRLNGTITQKLTDLGYDPALQPGAAAVVRRLGDLQGQNITLSGLDTLRKVASNGFVQGNKSNNKAISEIIDAVDDLVTNPQSADVLTGNAQAASSALKTAREMWSRLSKAERVASAVDRGELRAASTGSGGNADNAVRQNLRRIAENPRGFSQPEQDALRKVVEGTPTQNALRLAGKLSPSGNGLMAALGIGGTMINPAVGLASLGGMGAKAAADAMTRGNVSALDALIRNGGIAPGTNSVPLLQQLIVEALTRGSAQQLPKYTNR